MVLHENHNRIYDYIIQDDLVNDELIESFLKVINNFIQQTFRSASPVDRIIHDDFFILVKTIDNLQFVYVFKGRHSLDSFQRFDEIVISMLGIPEIIDGLQNGDIDSIQSTIDELVSSQLLLVE
jgi:hypothetical protein